MLVLPEPGLALQIGCWMSVVLASASFDSHTVRYPTRNPNRDVLVGLRSSTHLVTIIIALAASPLERSGYCLEPCKAEECPGATNSTFSAPASTPNSKPSPLTLNLEIQTLKPHPPAVSHQSHPSRGLRFHVVPGERFAAYFCFNFDAPLGLKVYGVSEARSLRALHRHNPNVMGCRPDE